MDADILLEPHRAFTNMMCDNCQREITEGEDFYYDIDLEETYCENCVTFNKDSD